MIKASSIIFLAGFHPEIFSPAQEGVLDISGWKLSEATSKITWLKYLFKKLTPYSLMWVEH